MKEKTKELSRIYQVRENAFSLPEAREYNEELVISNVYSLLTNDYVKGLLIGSREEGVFSREDKKSPEKRFAEALGELTQLIGDFFIEEMDFSGITSYSKMWKELQSYEREKPTETTLVGRRKLREIFEYQREHLMRLGVRPSLYGSFRYGDAGRNSDIDLKFLMNDGDRLKEVKEVVRCIEWDIDKQMGAIDAVTKKKGRVNQITDVWRLDDIIVDLSVVRSVLIDILDKATTEVGDYAYEGANFYPYNWIREGICLVEGLSRIDEEVEEIKELVDEAVGADPFFEFLLCLPLYMSIHKRKTNLSRT